MFDELIFIFFFFLRYDFPMKGTSDQSVRAAVYNAHSELEGDQQKNLSISSLLATFLSLCIAQWGKAVPLSCDPCRVAAWH